MGRRRRPSAQTVILGCRAVGILHERPQDERLLYRLAFHTTGNCILPHLHTKYSHINIENRPILAHFH